MSSIKIGKFTDRVFMSSPTMHGEEQEYIKEAFDTNWIAPLGTNVDAFERDMAQYIGCRGATALSSGTAAIHLAVKLAGVTKNDVVFCSDLTFAATVNPIIYEGGRPVFIDAERDTWNMDPKALQKAFEKYDGSVHEDGVLYKKPKAVIVANLYGTPAKLDEIRGICNEYNTFLIEDAAESLGATYKGRQTGRFGHFSALSFNGNKIITTSGGGMLLSDDTDRLLKAKFWATQAREDFPYYYHKEIGYNYRMSNIIAGVGRGQLLHLDEHCSKKADIYKTYKKELAEMPLSMNPYEDCSHPNFWLSCILLNQECLINPEQIRVDLENYNVESRLIWRPMHMQPVYEMNDFIKIEEECVSEDIYNRGLCLPSDLKMSKEDQKLIIEIIKNIVMSNNQREIL
ncbi:DegT/DnrJ/EryC1/StrS family aminotransferase [Extibacter muris]|uniref:DegT/DnrJ/EryC1/StrS family aminotransferase n=1 Tax=Extibacter muris TaxID=1796622 RepID=UPI001D0883A7|nr:aminotransferase class I/II-fold pyridoxal phosphate-dependent enzyme [Extibacter muris]MCB6203670.1 aminotransferase class I/II-fold pyridoxal phosphate-dependent enzyme [Extibacter muris]MCQ4665224.1 aminotransferase class I/II-fold pyridoxal phosphate-dependent enzyme [Extibacter muris]MCQ4694638.1 aminotransferase class I/II-fold pyridoxal phosphate-dependent enzyme [Extibacter muris]